MWRHHNETRLRILPRYRVDNLVSRRRLQRMLYPCYLGYPLLRDARSFDS